MKKAIGIIILGLFWCNVVYALPECKGEDYSKWTNCVGTYTNDEGRKYTGEFGNDPGMRHGKGISITKNGGKYIGTFKNDKADGRGTAISSKGVKYVGQFKDGKFHWRGTFLIPEIKSKYDGQWKDGKQHGYGRDITEGESKYAGYWKDGKQHGRRTFILYESKAKYIGQWKDGQISKGTLITPEAKYVGEFKDYLGHGQGTATYTDGRVEKGIWENGKLVKEQ